MAYALRSQDSAPIADMNLTPLIDVMLVLLVMFIITIPLQTHSVKLDLPQNGPIPTLPDPVKNKVVVTDEGQLLWNAAPVSMDGLRYSLTLTQQMYPLAELHLQPEPNARYALVDEVLAITKRGSRRWASSATSATRPSRRSRTPYWRCARLRVMDAPRWSHTGISQS